MYKIRSLFGTSFHNLNAERPTHAIVFNEDVSRTWFHVSLMLATGVSICHTSVVSEVSRTFQTSACSVQ